jgi:glycine/serine hydroxymethyltransferase
MQFDKEIFSFIEREFDSTTTEGLELIASENFTSDK